MATIVSFAGIIGASESTVKTKLSRRTLTLNRQLLRYLFLASNEAEAAQLERNHQIQLHAGCRPEDMTLLSPSELDRRFPWMNTDGLLLGSLGVSGEGWFDPWALLQSFYHKNRSMGVEYWHGSPQAARRKSDTGMIEAVQLLNHSSSSSSGGAGAGTGRTEWVRVNQVVNAAGPFAEDVVRTLVGEDVYRDGLHVPVKPRKRSVFFLHCAADQTSHPAPDIYPMTVDPYQGVYIRTEGSPGQHRFLCGVSPPCEEDVDCEDTTQAVQEGADHHLWEDCIWPALYHRIPALEAVKVMSSWAGLYDYNTIDQNAIIDWYGPNLLLVNGFSGHGLQHSPAARRAAAELLDLGHFETLNLDVFSLDRLKPATASASASVSASGSGSTGSTKDHHSESDESIPPPPIAVGRKAPPSVLHETGIV